MTQIALVQTAGASGWLSQLFSFAPIIIIVAIFYFIVIAPANKQRRRTEAMLAALKKGDRVVTAAGIYGTVQGVENDIVFLKIAENTKVKISKSAIASLDASTSSE